MDCRHCRCGSRQSYWRQAVVGALWVYCRRPNSQMPSTVNVCLLPAGGNKSAGQDWMHQGCSSLIMSLNACVYGLHLDLQIAVH